MLKKHYQPPSPHVYPDGQQCFLSEQHTAFGTGQHPYRSPPIGQHVSPSGHCCSPPGQVTDKMGFLSCVALACCKALIFKEPFVQ